MFKNIFVLIVIAPLLAFCDPDFQSLVAQAPGMEQLIAVKASLEPATIAQVWVLENEKWSKSGEEFAVVVGRNGSTQNKIEGDGKTPEGLYPINEMFGVAERIDLKMKYTQLTKNDKWIDDVKHIDYNKWIRGTTTAKSFETLLRKDHQYDLFAVVGYNMNPIIPGKGSAIFLHIWRSEGNGTDGCVAMSPESMQIVAPLLSPERKPYIYIGIK